MKKINFYFIVLTILLLSCNDNSLRIDEIADESPFIVGKQEYLGSPYVTAGDRVYAVGHQNGSFPDLGWHIKGEMGGIWNHPIKLMDGFEIGLILQSGDTLNLEQAHTFTNYPYANKFTYKWSNHNIEVDRWQFVPDGKQGMVVQLVLRNSGIDQQARITFTGISDLRPTWLGERTNMVDSKDIAKFDETLNLWKVKDTNNEWHTVYGSQHKNAHPIKTSSLATDNNTTKTSIEQQFDLVNGKTEVINYFIAGSYHSEEDALETYQSLIDELEIDVVSKKERYIQLANQTKLTIPDKRLQETFEWLKYNCDWLIRDVPEIGRGITAGIPDSG